ncbi:phospholipase D-like domain-containing protein [Methylocystis sp. ATCC 49242]|uniref:phospholipase D-like domain-containing protein n=1 Tax=Methylocystis sp. ATCC 49242 TaxID=622637 RepID=UPI0001F868D1|nr:phospholipase D-like domain-containing protein [Methylocystis sp. ATCC 49242]
MSSNSWQTLGTGKVLGYLRPDLTSASSSVWVLGPWIDAFFAEVLLSLPAAVDLRVVTRPPYQASSSFREHGIAARARLDERPNTTVRVLANLHAKLVIIDEQVVYCGSANWYRFSLEESRELVLRGPVVSAIGLMDEVQVIWDEATQEGFPHAPVKSQSTADGYMKEVIDPIAEAKLREVPGSFVLKRPLR